MWEYYLPNKRYSHCAPDSDTTEISKIIFIAETQKSSKLDQ